MIELTKVVLSMADAQIDRIYRYRVLVVMEGVEETREVERWFCHLLDATDYARGEAGNQLSLHVCLRDDLTGQCVYHK